ncbi:Transcriptional repressor CTCF [Taenia crassiceps]|uniref:Transcriptional repressor CTCF n=1 Tax=Taenia crassiceps TaxID=6207 RepID=A0ABR4QL41_9CEST
MRGNIMPQSGVLLGAFLGFVGLVPVELFRAFRVGIPQINQVKPYVLQSLYVRPSLDKSEMDSDYLAAKRGASRGSDSIFRSSPKRVKLHNFSSNGDKTSLLLDQPTPKSRSIACSVPVAQAESDKMAPSKKRENQEQTSSCIAKPCNPCEGQAHGSNVPFCSLASGSYSKITDLLTEPINKPPADSQVDGQLINSNDARHFSNTSSSPYVCSKCSKTFRTKLLLTHHNDTHDPSKGHRCSFPDCERAFRSQKYLDNHINDHHRSSSNLKCLHPFCSFVGTKKADLKRHIASTHKSTALNQSPSFLSFGDARNEAGECLSDEYLDDAMEIMSRNLKEIYATRPALSPVYVANPSLEANVAAISGDHFSPDETSSTISAPSFSNGGCVTGTAMTPPSSNLPYPSPVSCPSRSFGLYHAQPSDSSTQWLSQATMPNGLAVVDDSPNVARVPYPITKSPFGKDHNIFPSDVNQIRCPPPDWDHPFQLNGHGNYNAQYPYAPRCDNTRSYPTSGKQQPFYHSQPQPATVMPFYHCDRQSSNSLPFPTGGNAYGQVSLAASSSSYCHDYYQQPCFFQQPSFGSPQRQGSCLQIDAQQSGAQMCGASQRSSDLAYATISQQLYDAPTPTWPSTAGCYQPVGQSRRFQSGMSASAVFQAAAAATAPHHNPVEY